MQPQRLDITLAFKAISLSDALSGGEKEVAVAIIDSFNFRTQQCDPSFDRIAHLVGKSRRTIIRAVQRLEKLKFLAKVRHGGHFHRNSYQPNWPQFRLLEASWKARKATRHWAADVAPSKVPDSSHIAGDEPGTQTISINQSSETKPPVPPISDVQDVTGQKGNSNKQERSPLGHLCSPTRGNIFTKASVADSAAAARLSAEHRWNSALLRKLVDRPDLYALVIEAVDPDLQRKATEAELLRKGAGLGLIIKELKNRGLDL